MQVDESREPIGRQQFLLPDPETLADNLKRRHAKSHYVPMVWTKCNIAPR